MPSYIEKTEEVTLPVVVLRGSIAFPAATLNFEPADEEAANAAKIAGAANAFLFLTSHNDNETENEPATPDIEELMRRLEILTGEADEESEQDSDSEESLTEDSSETSKSVESFPFYKVGTVAKIKQMIRTPEGETRIIAEGFMRATALRFRRIKNHIEADLICKHIILPDNGGVRGEAAIHEMLRALEKNASLLPANTDDIMNAAKLFQDPGMLADFIAANVLVRDIDKQAVLECFDPLRRAEVLLEILAEETEILQEEAIIRRRVNARMNRNQREYYLREQIKVIQEELGEGNDVEEFAARIEEAKLPEEVKAKLTKENDRLAKVPFGSAEATVIANYLDTCLEIPWTKTTKDRVRFSAVQKVLDADHNGLEKVKERIVEYIAVKQLNPELRNQILCLVGPPGVGKTSIAASIARAMNRKYVRISLGGVRDEADIRGHRKTYIGAMPGRIIHALTQAGVRNPLILLDEIDKLTRDSHGDPTSALLEVLDGEQNKTFRDHFVELPFDLSDCMFIATANSLDTIPRPLRDRMEIIELSIYTKREKLAIAKDHLIPKQLERHGLNKKMLRITDKALIEIIDYYTREAGVRNLERTIASLCRKAGKKLLAEKLTHVTVDAGDVAVYLGARKLLPEQIEEENEIGTVNGLAYTELGGTLLKVEVAVMEGSGKIETTGSLGDVMKESARLAVSYVRTVASEYGIPSDFYKTKDIHIHFPEGAVPKDGPSAGVTMITALVSALSGIPVRRDVAMTGEISLRGNVLAIGGLKEKTMAAYSAGAKTVLIPYDNLRDLEELDPLARDNLELVPCRKVSEVLERALVPTKKDKAEKATENNTIAASKFIPVNTPSAPQVRFGEKN